MKKYLLFLLLIGLVLFQSCLSLSRKIVINKDGSGQESVQIDFSRDFMDMIVSFASALDTARYQQIRDSIFNDDNFIMESKEDYEGIQGVTINDINSRTNSDSSKTLNLILSFNSINALQNIYDKEASEDGNSATVTYDESGNRINYSLIYKKKPMQEAQDTSMAGLRTSIAEMMKNDTYTMEVEFPYPVESTNGEKISPRVVMWKYKITDLYNLQDSLVMDAVLLKD